MIIEYRMNSFNSAMQYSRILRTYKDVTHVRQAEKVTYLYGTIPAVVDPKTPVDLPLRNSRWAEEYIIAAINLAPGEYLERVDLPRD